MTISLTFGFLTIFSGILVDVCVTLYLTDLRSLIVT